MPTPLNHGPSTSAGWRERIAQLQHETSEAQKHFEIARQARAAADAQGVLSGKPDESLEKLEKAESKAQRRVQALEAAVTMA